MNCLIRKENMEQLKLQLKRLLIRLNNNPILINNPCYKTIINNLLEDISDDIKKIYFKEGNKDITIKFSDKDNILNTIVIDSKDKYSLHYLVIKENSWHPSEGFSLNKEAIKENKISINEDNTISLLITKSYSTFLDDSKEEKNTFSNIELYVYDKDGNIIKSDNKYYPPMKIKIKKNIPRIHILRK